MINHEQRRIADALEELVLLVKNYTFDDSEFSGVEPVKDFAERMDAKPVEAPCLKTISPEQAANDSGMELDPPDAPIAYDPAHRRLTDYERVLMSQLTESQARERELETELVRLSARLRAMEIDAKGAADVDAD